MSEKFSLDAILPPFEDERPKSTLIVQGPSVPMPQSPTFRDATGKDLASVLRALGPDERRQIWQSVYGKCSTSNCQNYSVTDEPVQLCVECLFAAKQDTPAATAYTDSPTGLVTEAMRDWWGVFSGHDTSVIQRPPRLDKLIAIFRYESAARAVATSDTSVTVAKLSDVIPPLPPAPA
jgi:hypothetical protein